jgi:membrane protein implicated in regulation of membrane protease activity
MPENAQVDSQIDKEAEIDKSVDGNDSLLEVSPVGLPISLRGILLGGGVLLVVLLLISVFLPNLSERVKFFTVNALSLLVLLVIAVQTYIYRRQWEVIERQEKVMQEQSEAMKGQLEAMRESLTETRKSMRYSQAAYITVKAIDATTFIVGEKIEVTIIFTNDGNTPAYNVDTYSRGGGRKEPFSFARDEIKTDFPHGVPSKGILAPHDVVTQVFGTDMRLTTSDLARMRRTPYHAWGVVFYQDIFKRDRWTQFSYVWREKREWGDDRGVFEICADCNRTDDQE